MYIGLCNFDRNFIFRNTRLFDLHLRFFICVFNKTIDIRFKKQLILIVVGTE